MRKISNLKFNILNFQKGFTLVELLVVVAIISILTTLFMANFVGIRQRGKDAQRKSELKQIQSVLELYRADQGVYPQSGGGNGSFPITCGATASLTNSDGSMIYMQKISCDPLGTTYWNSGVYYYSSNGTTYTIGSCIENGNDTDQNITGVSPSGDAQNCSSGKYFVLQNP